ncbi:MAG: hypothetical protein D6689_20195 [Deltaproteobacteria bacterium]|nr:MAG: hypothetical protein D6689_20195 [Deltaproteobacteria bacterium]
MSRHVPPHRWADLDDGRLSARAAARADRHARECAACAAARERVRAARAELRAVAADEPPALRWDTIRAQVYWTLAQERRAGAPARRRLPMGAVAAGAVAVAAAAAIALRWPTREPPRPPARAHATAAPPAAGGARLPPAPDAAPDQPPAPPVRGVVTLAEGDVTAGGAPLAFDELVGAGARLATGTGRLVVQFDADSVIALGPRTVVDVVAFDAAQVRLRVAGQVDIEVSRRAPGQRFVVEAGVRRIEVRGTAFRVVHRAGRLRVACTHGRVAVVDGSAATEVPAGHVIDVLDDLAAAGAARPLADREVARLRRALDVPRIPHWRSAEAALVDTARVDVPDAAARVDGIAVAPAAAVRVPPGRHQVAVGRRARWLDVRAGERALARVEDAARERRSAARAAQVDRALRRERARLARCARPLVSHGIAGGSFVTVELGINRDGSQGYLNVIDGNVPRSVAECVRDVVDAIAFPAGRPARVVQRISLAP